MMYRIALWIQNLGIWINNKNNINNSNTTNNQQNLSSNSLPYPPGEGGIKIQVIEKLVVEPKLQNMYFKTYKNKTQSKR